MESTTKRSSHTDDNDSYKNFPANELALLPRCNSSSCVLLNSDGYISLGNILATYDAPINEEHAWALCYLSAKYLETHLLSSNISSHGYILHFKQIVDRSGLIKIHHQDGHVFLDVDPISEKNDSLDFHVLGKNTLTKFELISKIALLIYQALDFGLKEDEERSLNIELENILDRMASCRSSRIDNDKKLQEEDQNMQDDYCSEQDIIHACLVHFQQTGLGTNENCDSYYRQVCRNLAADALEFSKFVRVAERASERLKYFCCATNNKLLSDESTKRFEQDLRAVAKVWMHVVRELRHGVKLKRLDAPDSLGCSHREYKKTPYELLLEDIRTQKYKLRKVSQNKPERPNENLDLHDVIMAYIRSRPTLRKASERVLKPVTPKRSDPYEELMKSIRQVHHLRPVASKISI